MTMKIIMTLVAISGGWIPLGMSLFSPTEPYAIFYVVGPIIITGVMALIGIIWDLD